MILNFQRGKNYSPCRWMINSHFSSWGHLPALVWPRQKTLLIEREMYKAFSGQAGQEWKKGNLKHIKCTSGFSHRTLVKFWFCTGSWGAKLKASERQSEIFCSLMKLRQQRLAEGGDMPQMHSWFPFKTFARFYDVGSGDWRAGLRTLEK